MNKPFTILITGCSSGIGHRAAEMLRDRGHQIFATARQMKDVQALQAQGFKSVQLDLNDSASIQKAVAEVLAQTNNTLDVLINNAGYGQVGAVEDLTRDHLRTQFETNLFGPQELTNLIIPIMRKQGHGRIINVSSVLGLVAMTYQGAYNASKFAMEGLTDTLRLELRGTGIYVSLIEPGPIFSQFRNSARAVYEKTIDMTKSPHRAVYQTLLDNMDKTKDTSIFTAPPDAVVKKMIHAIESPRPKIHYYVTFPVYLLAAFRRLLPYRALDWVLWRASSRNL